MIERRRLLLAAVGLLAVPSPAIVRAASLMPVSVPWLTANEFADQLDSKRLHHPLFELRHGGGVWLDMPGLPAVSSYSRSPTYQMNDGRWITLTKKIGRTIQVGAGTRMDHYRFKRIA